MTTMTTMTTMTRAAAGMAAAPVAPIPPADSQSVPLDAGRPPDALADNDAGTMIDAPMPPLPDAGAREEAPPPVAEESPACRGRIGYVSQTGHCYFVHAATLSWHQSRDECGKLGGHLATITSEREQTFIASIQWPQEIWIGLSKFGSTDFSWITNEDLGFTSWEPDAPRPSQESAVVIVPETGMWSDRSPMDQHPGLCELMKKS